MDALKSEIAKGAELKHVETDDKAAPKIEADVKIGENKHGDLLSEVTKGAELKHVETDDKSAPKIDADVKVGENKHGDLMSEIQAQKKD
jgi:hypothetical protein